MPTIDARRNRRCSFGAYAAMVIAASCAQGQEAAKLAASDGATGDFFGESLSVSNDVIVIGTPWDDDGGVDSGSAYVFVRLADAWTTTAKLSAPDRTSSDYFGSAVCVLDDTILVGAPGDDNSAGNNAGSVYVFRFNGSNWLPEAKLTAQDGAAGDGFGGSVVIASDILVVGASGDDESAGINAGSAYVFRFDGSAWMLESKFIAPDGAADDAFGTSVSASGDAVVVGAPGDDDVTGSNVGSAYVFRFDGSPWMLESKLSAPGGAAEALFGTSVGISDDVVVVGASHANSAFSGGSAYAFRYDGMAWTGDGTLLASDGMSGDQFGRSVSIRRDAVVVGAPGDDSQSRQDAGSAYLFRYDGQVWKEDRKLSASDGAAADSFGHSVSIRQDAAVVSAPTDDDHGVDSGSVYMFWTLAADCDENRVVDTRDVICFLNRWLQQHLSADCDSNGRIDSRDVICFFNLWAPAR